MDPRVEKINVRGLNINARIWGNPDGFPILGLHGWLDNAGTFDLIAPYISDFHFVSVDFPGHGYSDHLPQYSIYNNPERIMQILMLVSELGWKEYYVLGHSMGGIVGMMMAVVDSERIKKIATVDVFNFQFLSENDVIKALREIYKSTTRSYPAHSLYKSVEEAAERRASVNNVMPLTYESSLTLAKAGLHKVENGYEWTFDTRLLARSPSLMSHSQIEEVLSNIRAKLCLILGNQGLKMLYPKMGENTHLVANHEVHEVEGGHHVHLDSPNTVGPILQAFFKS